MSQRSFSASTRWCISDPGRIQRSRSWVVNDTTPVAPPAGGLRMHAMLTSEPHDVDLVPRDLVAGEGHPRRARRGEHEPVRVAPDLAAQVRDALVAPDVHELEV